MILVCEEEEKAVVQAFIQGHIPILREDWFASPVWTAIARLLVNRGKPSGKPQLAGWLANVGLGEYVEECYAEVPYDGAVLKSLQDRAARRLLSVLADQVKASALDPAVSVLDVVAGAFDPIFNLYPQGAAVDLVSWALSYVGGQERLGYTASWPLLTSIVGPLAANRLFVLLGKPSVGKSIWALSLALDVARQGGRVVFNSLDMGVERTFLRLISATTGIGFTNLWHRNLSPSEWQVFREAEGALRALPLEIVLVRSVEEFGRISEGADMAVVDFLQRCATPRGESTAEQVTAIVASLKKQAQDHFVLAISQTQRGDDIGGFEIGIWSSAIEQDADVWAILLPHEKHRRIVELDIRKHRDGPTGRIPYLIYFEVETALELSRLKDTEFIVGGEE